MKIAVIDGKGGGMGRAIVDKLKQYENLKAEIIVLGTNSLATSNMLKAGGVNGATGENAIVCMSQKVDYIIGPLAIIAANSMMGEVTPRMAEAVSSSDAKKILLPISKCHIDVVGVEGLQLKDILDKIIEHID